MQQLPLVSIVTIVYNGEKFIEKCIQSVLGQSYSDIEYIIIDGGSTDHTVDIIQRYAGSVAAWISERDEGISDAFNKGLKLANGEIVGIINADDWYEPYTIEKVVQEIKNFDIAYGDLRLWKSDKVDFVLQGNHAYLENEMTVNHPTVFVKRECYEKYGQFNTQLKCAMDYDLMLRFKINHCRFGYVPAVLANMRWEGLSDAQWLLGCKETLFIKNKYMPSQKIRNRLYFYKHVLANAIPRMLVKLKMGFIIKKYRSMFSKVKKVYE